MIILAEKTDLMSRLNTVLKAVPVRTSFPIMECILVDASQGIITLTANDSEFGIETVLDGTIVEPGIVAIEAKIFSDIVRNLPDDSVEIVVDSSNLARIRCGESVFNIACRDAYDFVRLPEVDRSRMIRLSQFSLKEIIRQTIFSTADNENNLLMSGEYFEVKGNILRVISLDGQRISIRKIELKESYEDAKIVIPGRALNEISKILGGGADEDASIYFTDNLVLFEFGDTKVVTRLIDGEYFQVDRMISGDYSTKIRINKRSLQECIERASLLVRESDRRPVIINIIEDRMEISIKSSLGSMNEKIGVDREGRDLMIGFNPRFVLDAVRAVDEEEVSIYFTSARAPFIMKNDEESYIYLILPISFNM